MLSRRSLLKSAAALAAAAVAPPIFFATPAAAFPVMAAFAVGSFVAGQIAAHNRRDIGLIYGRANYETLRVISGQLETLQLATGSMLTALAQFPKEVEAILRRQSVRELHDQIRAAVRLYDQQRASLPQFEGNQDAWLAASHRTAELTWILHLLREARAKLAVSDVPIDAAACVVIASGSLAEMSILNLLNTDPRDALVTIGDYQSFFSKVKDASLPGSAAAYLAEHRNARAEVEKKIASDPLGSKLGGGKMVVGACAGIEDYRASMKGMEMANMDLTAHSRSPILFNKEIGDAASDRAFPSLLSR